MKKVVMAFLVALSFSRGDAEIAEGLVGWWKMEAVQDGKIADASGCGSALSIGTGCSVVESDFGGALRFDGGTNAWATFPCAKLSGSRTFSAWIRPERSGCRVEGQRLAMLLVNDCFRILLDSRSEEHSSESVTIYIDRKQTLNRDGRVDIDTGEWHHWAWVYEVEKKDGSGTSGRFLYYRDGRLVGKSSPFTVANCTSIGGEKTWIGNRTGFQRPIFGALSDVRLYNRAVTEEEVREIYRLATPPLPVPHEQARAVVEPDEIIASDGYCGWPTVCRRASGEMIVVYSGDRTSHIDPWGKVRLVRSPDEGKTWGKPETAVNSIVDDRDAGILETKEGTLVLFWFNSLAWLDGLSRLPSRNPVVLHTSKLPPQKELAKLCGSFTARSKDGGKTWTDIMRTDGNANHGGIQLRDGRLLQVGRRGGNAHCLPVIESRDDGRTWQTISHVLPSEGERLNQFHEPHVVEFSDGRLLALFRYHAFNYGHPSGFSQWYMRQAESLDGGKTWTRMKNTGILGHPPHLLKTKGGKLVVVYAKRLAPDFGQYACVSDDEGRTWDVQNEILLAKGFSGDNGYPSSVELSDGSIYTVYYGKESKFLPCCLHGVRWRLK